MDIQGSDNQRGGGLVGGRGLISILKKLCEARKLVLTPHPSLTTNPT